VTSFPVTWLPPPASFTLVKAQTYPKRSFRASTPISRWLPEKWSVPVTWGHVTSFPVTWLPPPASYGPVGAQVYPKLKFSTFYSHFQVTFGWMMSLAGHFWLRVVTWRHFPTRDCHVLRVTALYVLKLTKNASFRPSTATSGQLPVKLHPFWVTSGDMGSRDIISCELQPCRSSNVHKTWVFGLLQPLPETSGEMTSLPGHFRSLVVTWRHFLSCDCHLLRVTALLELRHTRNASFRPSTGTSGRLPVKLHPFWVTCGDMGSCDIISCHMTATSCELQPYRSSNIPQTEVFGLLQSLPGDFRWNDTTYRTLPVRWGHIILSCDCHLPRVTALQELKRTQDVSFRLSTGTSGWLPVKWRHFRVASSHVGSRDVIFCDMTATSCELQPCRSSNVLQNRSFRPSTATSRWLPVKWHHFQVSYGHVGSHDASHGTATSCKLQPCKGSNIPKTRVFCLLQPLPGDFWWIDVTSGSLTVTLGHVTAFPITWIPPHGSYSPVRTQTYTKKASFRPTATSRWLPVN